MSNLRIIDEGKKYGTFSLASKFYSRELSLEERKLLQLKRRMAMGNDYGFDGHCIFMADQEKLDGSYFEITEDYVKNNPFGWTDIKEDILVITDKVPGVVIGHPVADCPVVMMSDPVNQVSAICHCGALMIDKKLPIMISEVLQDKYFSKIENIETYVSSCCGIDYTYNNYPGWANDKDLWKNGIEYVDGKFRINLRKVLIEEFKQAKIDLEKVCFSKIDTINNPNYYSNFASNESGLNDSSKFGRNFAGLFYEEDSLIKKR